MRLDLTLPLSAALVAFLIATWNVLHHSPNGGRDFRHKSISLGLYLLSAVISFWSIIAAYQSSTASASDAQKWRNEQSHKLDKIGAESGDSDLLQRYIKDEEILTQQYTASAAAGPIDRFFATEDERNRIKHEVDAANLRIQADYKVKFQPMYDFISSSFDAWMAGIQKHGIDLRMEKNEHSCVIIGQSDQMYNIRTVRFKNGGLLTLGILPAAIDNAQVSSSLEMVISGVFPDGVNHDFWGSLFGEHEYLLQNRDALHLSFKSCRGTAAFPIEDTKFLSAVTGSMNEVLAYATAEGDPGK